MIIRVPIVAIMFMNFCALILLLNIFSIAKNINKPSTPPKVFVTMSVLSKAPILKIS